MGVVFNPFTGQFDFVGTGGGTSAVDSVNGQTGVVVLDPDDLDDTSTTNKFTTSSDITKLSGIEANADVTDSTNVATAGAFMKATDDLDDITDGTTNKAFTSTEKTKLSGIASSATANSSDATLLNRANHTGSQAISTVTGLQTSLDSKLEDVDISDINATGTASATTYLRGDGSWTTPAGGGGGDVSAASNFGTDNVIIRSDGTSKGVQSSGVTIDDLDNLTANNISGTNTGDQDLSGYQLKPSEGAFVNGDKTKLDGIEANADVTDTTNVTAAGALMDSEVDADIKTLSLPANTTITTFGASLVNSAANTNARSTLGLGTLATASNVNDSNWSGTDLSVANGGTGVSSHTSGNYLKGAGTSAITSVSAATLKSELSLTKSDVGLSNVDNTSDVNKPISTATQTALDGTVKSTTTETLTVSSTEPSSPTEGDIWLDILRKFGKDDIDFTTFFNGLIEIQYGTGSVSAVSGTVVTASVSFAKTFSGTPKVFIQSSSANATAIQTMYAATSESTTGFTLNARHPSASGSVGYKWVAVNVTVN